MSESSSSKGDICLDVVQVHITIHQQDYNLNIDFPVDRINDDIDQIADELVERLGMSDLDKKSIKEMIEAELNKSNNINNFEPIENQIDSNDQLFNEESSDDSDISDPEYTILLEQQKKDMSMLLEKHINEKRELAKQIASSPIINLQENIQEQTKLNPDEPQIVNDLIVFT